ncbi:hypothetical protein HMPREF3009_08575 [Corynebacterium sp. HMSC034H07]|nr:hypothetical protein HMPREF3009_08575 [Corynebacterium sp. HMSC034H07]
MALFECCLAGFALFACKAGGAEVHLVQASKLGSIKGIRAERAKLIGCARYMLHQRNPRVAEAEVGFDIPHGHED